MKIKKLGYVLILLSFFFSWIQIAMAISILYRNLFGIPEDESIFIEFAGNGDDSFLIIPSLLGIFLFVSGVYIVRHSKIENCKCSHDKSKHNTLGCVDCQCDVNIEQMQGVSPKFLKIISFTLLGIGMYRVINSLYSSYHMEHGAVDLESFYITLFGAIISAIYSSFLFFIFSFLFYRKSVKVKPLSG